ncbi:MAG: hypothetical protein IPG60_10150 [Bacteroidetes bacterium]|nr:hypothetical protein [Bacteroidota bacterium]MBK7108794.1 hypothetical protein [Bacteroidota bacterium]MBK8488881.1 hypothetical protein [Bacteroidota bacterium]MBK8680733.1 hypothetical protein [Bacteroidota bacterium]
MEKLINELVNKAGLTEEQARKSAETVSFFLKERVPSGFRSQIDNLLKGEKLGDSIKEGLMDSAVDVKEKMEDVLKDVGGVTEEAIQNIKKKMNEMFNKKKEE